MKTPDGFAEELLRLAGNLNLRASEAADRMAHAIAARDAEHATERARLEARIQALRDGLAAIGYPKVDDEYEPCPHCKGSREWCDERNTCAGAPARRALAADDVARKG